MDAARAHAKGRSLALRRRVLGFTLSVLVLSGCAGRPSPLRVGTNVWPGYEPLFLAQSLGYYSGKPIKLLTLPSSVEVMRSYRNGAIDVAALTADETLQVAATLPDQRIFLVCDFSNGADVLLANPQFSTLKDLRGRRIGVEQNALGAYMLTRALESCGMSVKDVTVVPVPLEEHEEAFAAGRVDALVTFEPRRSKLLAAGARQIFDSSQIPGEVVDVLLTRNECLDADEASLDSLVSGWFRAVAYLRRAPQDAARRVAAREQTSADVFLGTLNGIQLPGPSDNLRLLGDSPENLQKTLRRLRSVMVENKLLVSAPESGIRLDDRCVRSATR